MEFIRQFSIKSFYKIFSSAATLCKLRAAPSFASTSVSALDLFDARCHAGYFFGSRSARIKVEPLGQQVWTKFLISARRRSESFVCPGISNAFRAFAGKVCRAAFGYELSETPTPRTPNSRKLNGRWRRFAVEKRASEKLIRLPYTGLAGSER